MDLQPTLQGKLLSLRPLREDDLEGLFFVACDPLIWELHPARDRYQRPVFEEFFRQAIASKSALAVLDATNGTLIGTSRYALWPDDPDALEIGWTFLARAYWGGVHNAELKRLMLEHAFLFVKRVLFLADSQNHRSRRALAKIGAVAVGAQAGPPGHENLIYEVRRRA